LLLKKQNACPYFRCSAVLFLPSFPVAQILGSVQTKTAEKATWREMFNKLKKLEAKLSYIDVEDLYTLGPYSSDFQYIKCLQKFVAQYSEFYNISEIFKGNVSRKQFFIIVLIQRLSEGIQWIKTSYPPTSEVQRKDYFVKRKGKFLLFPLIIQPLFLFLIPFSPPFCSSSLYYRIVTDLLQRKPRFLESPPGLSVVLVAFVYHFREKQSFPRFPQVNPILSESLGQFPE
jgi:hypothetical protein